jgi:hypothetical protein
VQGFWKRILKLTKKYGGLSKIQLLVTFIIFGKGALSLCAKLSSDMGMKSISIGLLTLGELSSIELTIYLVGVQENINGFQ